MRNKTLLEASEALLDGIAHEAPKGASVGVQFNAGVWQEFRLAVARVRANPTPEDVAAIGAADAEERDRQVAAARAIVQSHEADVKAAEAEVAAAHKKHRAALDALETAKANESELANVAVRPADIAPRETDAEIAARAENGSSA